MTWTSTTYDPNFAGQEPIELPVERWHELAQIYSATAQKHLAAGVALRVSQYWKPLPPADDALCLRGFWRALQWIERWPKDEGCNFGIGELKFIVEHQPLADLPPRNWGVSSNGRGGVYVGASCVTLAAYAAADQDRLKVELRTRTRDDSEPCDAYLMCNLHPKFWQIGAAGFSAWVLAQLGEPYGSYRSKGWTYSMKTLYRDLQDDEDLPMGIASERELLAYIDKWPADDHVRRLARKAWKAYEQSLAG